MKIRDTYFLARRLVIEERYLALKNSSSFQDRITHIKNKDRFIMNYVNMSYAITIISFLIFSLILIYPALLSRNYETLSNIVLLLFVYVLFINISNSLIFFSSVNNNHLFDPMRILPIDLPENVIGLSWFIYSGSSSLFAVIPAVFVASFVLHSAYIVVIGSVWSVFSLLLGYTTGSFLFIYFGSKISGNHGRWISTLRNVARIVLIILIFVVFELILYNSRYLNALIPDFGYPYGFIIPVLNISKSMFFSNTGSRISLSIVIAVLYTAIVFFAFIRVNRIVFRRLAENRTIDMLKSSNFINHVRSIRDSLAFFIKDVKISTRKSQNLMLLLMPVFFIFPTIMSDLLYSRNPFADPVFLYYMLSTLVIVSSSFYALIFLVVEGNGITVLRSIPLDRGKIIRFKSIAPIFIFIIIIAFILPVMSIRIRIDAYDYLFIAFNLILSFCITLIFNMERLYSKIPPGADTVNFYSFGGQLAFIVTFLISGFIIGVTEIVSTIFSEIIRYPWIFFVSNSIINLVLAGILIIKLK